MNISKEFLIALSTSMILVSTVFQLVGFVSPYWGSDRLDYYTSSWGGDPGESGNMRGLIITCLPSGHCVADMLDSAIVGLSATAIVLLVPCCITVLVVTWKQLKRKRRLSWNFANSTATVFFIIAEVLAGVASILFFLDFGTLGWSALVFLLPGLVVFVPVATAVAILVAFVVFLLVCIKSGHRERVLQVLPEVDFT